MSLCLEEVWRTTFSEVSCCISVLNYAVLVCMSFLLLLDHGNFTMARSWFDFGGLCFFITVV